MRVDPARPRQLAGIFDVSKDTVRVLLQRRAGSWLPYTLYILGGLLLYSGTAAVGAWRYVPAGMDQRHWALIAAGAAPAWAVAGLAVALAVDALFRFLFKRNALGLGLGLVFISTHTRSPVNPAYNRAVQSPFSDLPILPSPSII